MENASIFSIGLETLEVNERDSQVIIPILRIGSSEGIVSVDYILKSYLYKITK